MFAVSHPLFKTDAQHQLCVLAGCAASSLGLVDTVVNDAAEGENARGIFNY